MTNENSKNSPSNPVCSRSFFYIARLVIETKTPLSIAAGETDDVYDNTLVRDANGLPALPGSSIAGVLRHLYGSVYSKDKAEVQALFGSKRKSERKEDDNDKESPSLVHVSWGCIHDSNDQPVQGLLDPAIDTWQKDKVLKDALQLVPVKRDHVKLTDKGVASASGMAKFDRVSLTAGHRFSFELSMWSEQADDERWEKLLNLLGQSEFRLGGKTRAGLGKLEVIRCYHGAFDLRFKPDALSDFEKFKSLEQDLGQIEGLEEYTVSTKQAAHQIHLKLDPEEGGYRIGSGTKPIDESEKTKKDNDKPDADLVSITEQRIHWNKDNKGSLNGREIVIPASGIKGAIRHRAAYYYSLLFPDESQTSDNDKTVEKLFGYTQKIDTETKKERGNVLIDDIYIPIDKKQTPLTMTHNSIDRFTGGVREHMLFLEEVITQDTPLEFSISLLGFKQDDIEKSPAIKALELALNDLIQGRLALGAGSGRIGSGYFTGSWSWEPTEESKGEQV